MADLGIPAITSQATYFQTSQPRYVTGIEVIKFGAKSEDDQYRFRALNHFFDPQFNFPAGRALSPGGVAVERTKVDTFVLVKLFLLLPPGGATHENRFKSTTYH